MLKENCPSQEYFRETQKLVRGHLRIHQALIGLYFIVFWEEKALPSNLNVEKALECDGNGSGSAELREGMMSGEKKTLSVLPTVHLYKCNQLE